MGFIDYQGTKEDRYIDVIEYAQSQQEEETRQIKDSRINKWIGDNIDDENFAGFSTNDAIRFIILKYRHLLELKDKIGAKDDKLLQVDSNILWNDFIIALVTKRMEAFDLSDNKRNICYQTFLGKVFKLNGFTTAEKHYKSIVENIKYHNYMSDCFDLVQEKQFWIWIRSISVNNIRLLTDFVNDYKCLSVILGYYLYLEIQPNDDRWLQRIDLEGQFLEKMKIEFMKKGFEKPDYDKIINPIYKEENLGRSAEALKQVAIEVVAASGRCIVDVKTLMKMN